MGSGPPLLLAHGIGMSRSAFSQVLEPLARDFEVVAVDLPGFGGSPLDRVPTMRGLADACAQTMAGLGHDRFHAAGNSLGGGVAVHLALDGRALSACGLSPVGFAGGWDRAWAHANLRLTYTIGGAAAALMRGPGRIGAVRRALVRTYLEHGERVAPEVFVSSFEELDARGGYRPTLRHAINWRCPAVDEPPCPITVAWGEHDRLLLTGPQARRARERLPSARHVTLTGCGHLPAWDDPALVVQTIRAAAAI